MPRTIDEHELGLRVVLDQQLGVGAARTFAGTLAARLGEPVNDPVGELNRLFPTAEAIVTSDPEELGLVLDDSHTFVALARALADGTVDLSPGADRAATRGALADLPGVDAATVEIITMRALGDPDAFPVTDRWLAGSGRAVGLPEDSTRLLERARAWQPWRAYATQHLDALASTPDHPDDNTPGRDDDATNL